MIEMTGVAKCFGGKAALSGVGLSVQGGSILGLVGPNGAGKSTLLRTMAGVYRPDSGEVWVDGARPWEGPGVKARIRLLPDAQWCARYRPLLQMGKALAPFYPTWDQGYFERLCQAFPLDEKARYITLSKGGRRQAGLILALASRPDFLLLDEVFDGLDPVVRKLVKKLIAEEVAQRGMTVVLASHNLREMEDFCDTLALLYQGGVVLEKELDDMALYLHRVQAVFPQMPDIGALKKKICMTSWTVKGSVLTFVARGQAAEIEAALAGFSPTFQEALPLSLEEVFISEMEASGYDMENILG